MYRCSESISSSVTVMKVTGVRQFSFGFLCATFVYLGILFYSNDTLSTRTTYSPNESRKHIAYDNNLKNSDGYENDTTRRRKNGKSHTNLSEKSITSNKDERNQDFHKMNEFKYSRKILAGLYEGAVHKTGTSANLLDKENDHDNGKTGRWQNQKQNRLKFETRWKWNKIVVKKPAHVVDQSVWDEMVKYFPFVLQRFMQPFLPKYKNPCFLERNQLRCLPYFYLAGTPKCGTSDLWFNLLRHPQVYDQVGKEPHFWKEHTKDDSGTEYYLSQFQTFAEFVSNQTKTRKKYIVGDGSASTLSVNKGIVKETKTLRRGEVPFVWGDVIQAINPNAKIILILRHPTNRSISDYFAFEKSRKISPENFHKRVVNKIKQLKRCLNQRSLRTCVNIMGPTQPRLHASLYVAHIREWLRVFPREQMLILRTEDWHYHENNNLLQEVFEVLEIDAIPESQLPPIDSKEAVRYMKWATVSQKGRDKYGDILPETKAILDKFFEPYNRELATLLNDERFLWK